MGEQIHDEELDTSEGVVRTLLSAQCPQWSTCPTEHLRTSGTDNAMWRVHVEDGADVVVRLPRRARWVDDVEREAELLRALPDALTSVVRVPTVRHLGEPHEAFPYRWSVLDWLRGTDAWTSREALQDHLDALALDVAGAVLAIRALEGVPARARAPGQRGGPIQPLLEQLDRWLDDPQWRASELLDVDLVRGLAAEVLDVLAEPVPSRFVHGDLIPGNLLVERRRLSAIIDWSSAGYGDPAQDLAPAWAVLDAPSRARFRDAVGADDATWLRARTIELVHAVGGILYYVPRGHPLGDVMARTLGRILHG